jgi:hypothetical protein
MNIKHNISTALRRLCGAATALAIAGGMAAFAPAAYAQAGTLSNPNNCTTFTGFTWANGTLTLSCAITPPPSPPSCDTAIEPTGFTIAAPAVSSAVNTTVNVTVSRQGTGCLSAYTVTYSSGGFPDGGNNMPIGYSVSGNGTLNFAAGEVGPKTISVSTGTAPGLIGVWLTGGTGPNGPIGVSGGTAITVTQTTSGGGNTGGNNPPPGCSSAATYMLPASNAQQIVFGTYEGVSQPPLKPGETASAGFVYQQAAGGGNLTLAMAQVTGGPAGGTADLEVAIATCPNVFEATNGDTLCDKRLTNGSQSQAGYNFLYAGAGVGVCRLNPGTQYYINIRQVSANYANGTTPSCGNVGGCALRIQPQSLN